jgi:hypothetical protein
MKEGRKEGQKTKEGEGRNIKEGTLRKEGRKERR